MIFGAEKAVRALTDINVAHVIACSDRWFTALVLAHSSALEKLSLSGADFRRNWDWALEFSDAPVVISPEQSIRTLAHIRIAHLVALLKSRLAALVLAHCAALEEFQVTGAFLRSRRRALTFVDTSIVLGPEHARRALTNIPIALLVALLDSGLTALVFTHRPTLEKLGLTRALGLRFLRFRALALGFQATVILRPEHTSWALTDVDVAHVVAHVSVLTPARLLAHRAALEKLGFTWALDRTFRFVLHAPIVGRALSAEWTLTDIFNTHKWTCHRRFNSALPLAERPTSHKLGLAGTFRLALILRLHTTVILRPEISERTLTDIRNTSQTTEIGGLLAAFTLAHRAALHEDSVARADWSGGLGPALVLRFDAPVVLRAKRAAWALT